MCGSGDVLSDGWDVEVVSDLGKEVGAALLEQGQSLSESAEVAVEGGVPEVGPTG